MEFRLETNADIAGIRRLHLASFPGPGEADLVDRLRSDSDAVFSLVAVDGGSVCGHALFSKMAAPANTLGLGPVAVLPEQRRQGIAARLITDSLAMAAGGGFRMVFVLGDPAYYGRFGFSAALARPFISPFAGPHLMGLVLGGGAPPDVMSGRLEYAPAFAGLS